MGAAISRRKIVEATTLIPTTSTGITSMSMTSMSSSHSPERGSGWLTDITFSIVPRFESKLADPTLRQATREPVKNPSGPQACASAWSRSPGASPIVTLRSGSCSMAVMRPKPR